MDKPQYSLWELAAAENVSARTVRYYISRGLLLPPRKAGRDAVYGAEHRQALQRIRSLQEQGLTLAEISRISAETEPRELPRPEQWAAYRLAADVQLLIRNDAAPWRVRKLRNLMIQIQATLNEEESDHE